MTAALVIVAALAAQQPAQLAPTHALSYGENRMQKIDLWIASSDEQTPLVLFIHGGGFRGGSYKQVSAQQVQFFLNKGISFASIEYRLTDQGPYPMQMNDCARAVQYLRSNAGKYNLDKKRVASYGGSAGACISMWLAFHDDMADPKSTDPVAKESTRLVAAGSQNGQPTLDPHTFKEWFGVKSLVMHPAIPLLFNVRNAEGLESPEARKLITDASPITHLTKDDAPVYLQYGGADTPVTETTDANTWVHHARLGIKLKEQMDKLGIECHVQYRGGPAVIKYSGVPEFLAAKLKG
jgi:acetyl esterase/lipase